MGSGDLEGDALILTGATEPRDLPELPELAELNGATGGTLGEDRRTNAASATESRMPGASGACTRGHAVVVVRTNGGAVIDGSRPTHDSGAGAAAGKAEGARSA